MRISEKAVIVVTRNDARSDAQSSAISDAHYSIFALRQRRRAAVRPADVPMIMSCQKFSDPLVGRLLTTGTGDHMHMHDNCFAIAMTRASQHLKDDSFNFRVDPKLKADFQSATEAADQPAAQVLRDFMRSYVSRHRQQAFAAEARRQSQLIAACAADPDSDEAEVMRWIEDVAGAASETT